jgi:peptidylprolyl isomerase
LRKNLVKLIENKNLWAPIATILLLGTAACQAENTVRAKETIEPTIPEISSGIQVEDHLTIDEAITTESGLQYIEIINGDGEAPKVGDIITMHFIGTLPDGTEFGNSYIQGSPIEVVWGREQLLPGWEEGIGLMRTGEKARFIIPAELGFGSQDFDIVPGNSPIIIEMELLSVERPPDPTIVKTSDLTITESGLQYYDITIGDGDEAIKHSNVATHYRIWVQEGEQDIFIASSYSAESVPFVLGRGNSVILGWDEGVFGMKQGGKRMVIIPPDLAFGEQSSSGIPANSTLIMEIELVDVKQPETITEVDEDAYTVTDSGLQYYDLKDGQGVMVSAGQSVVVHYTGWLEDGTQFDSSREFSEPLTFELGAGQVITGWDEGVAGMQVGGIRQIIIPPELGYGTVGAGNVIPPEATLIFQVELLEIKE